MKEFLIFSAFAVLFFSCGRNKNEKYINTTDSLINVVSGITAIVNAYESDTAEERYGKLKSEVDFIGQNMTTLPKGNTANIISEYANCSKGFKRFFKILFEIKTENNLSKSQLENLKKDLSAGTISGDEAALYLLEEEKAVNENNIKLNDAVVKYNSLCSETSKYTLFIGHISDSLKKLNKIQ